MNSALRISVVIAWLTVTLTVSPSHADGPLSTFSATITPLLASVINRLPTESINEITPHVEALADIVKGNALYDFFYQVQEECHKFQNQLGNKEQSTKPEETSEGKIEESQNKQESVSGSNVESEVSQKEKAAAETEEATNKKASEDQNNDKVNSESSSDDEGASKVSNGKTLLLVKELPNGVTKRYRWNNTNAWVALTKQGDKLSVVTKKPKEEKKSQPDVDISGEVGEQTVKKFVSSLIID